MTHYITLYLYVLVQSIISFQNLIHPFYHLLPSYNIYLIHTKNSNMDNAIRIFEKFEPNSERGLIKACEICTHEFGILNREHQCKRCFRAVCSDCGTTKRDVYKPKMAKRPHRLCKCCSKQSNFLIQYISVNNLKFGNDSQIAIKWHKKIPDNIKEDSLHTSQRQHRKLKIQIFNQLWDSYNYSLREFIGLMTYNSSQAQIHKLVEEVYQQMYKRGMDEKMEQSVFVIIFLLCFSNTKTCADLIEYLYSMKKTVTDNKQLLQLYLKGLSIEDSEIKKLSEYFNYKLKQYLGSFSINTITTECSIHVISRIFQKKKIEEAYMFFALAIEKNCEFLITNRNNKVQCDLMLVRNCDLQGFLDKYRLLVSIKTASLVTQRSVSTILQQNRQKFTNMHEPNSLQNSRVEEQIKFVANFKKNKPITTFSNSDEDSLSHKTTSIRDMDDSQYVNPRETQKIRDTNPKIYNKNRMQDTEIRANQIKQKHSKTVLEPSSAIYEPQAHKCRNCEHKQIKIDQLENKLSQKQRQITKLTLKLNFNGEDYEEKSESQMLGRDSATKNLKITNLQNEIREKIQQNQSLFKELNHYQRDNHRMKQQLQQMTMNNKMLKNRLESDNFGPHKISKNTQKQEQLLRQNQMYEKKLRQKNKQLEQLIKKNKLLAYQAQQMERDKGEGRSSSMGFREERKINIHAEQLLDKMKQLSQKVMEVEQENISINHQLFQSRQKIKMLQNQLSKAQQKLTEQQNQQNMRNSQKNQGGGGKQCSLF